MANEYGNYCTLNPLGEGTISEGNLKFVCAVNGDVNNGTLFIPTSGKWYWELLIGAFDANNGALGIKSIATVNSIPNLSSTGGYGMYISSNSGLNGHRFENSGTTLPGGGASQAVTFAVGDRMNIAYNADDNKLWYGKNGTFFNFETGATLTVDVSTAQFGSIIDQQYVPSVLGNAGTGGSTFTLNFGAIAFTDTPPSGYLALNTARLSTPAPINYEDEYYIEAGISHSNGSTTAVTLPKTVSGGAMVRIKRTDSNAGTSDWICFDTARGVNKAIFWNATAAEDSSTYDDQNLTGTTFTMPSDLTTGTYMIECFYVGSYFAILEDEGNGAHSRSINHGAGFLPAFIWRKNLEQASYNSVVFHKSVGTASYLYGSSTAAAVTGEGTAGAWSGGTFTTSVIIVGSNNDANQNGNDFVSYLWADAGPYAFGSYEGSGGATTAPFINTGFFPNTVITKSIDSTSGWQLYSAKATTSNPRAYLSLQATAALSNLSEPFDIYSNGFKSYVAFDPNVAETYIYMALGGRPLTDGGVNQGRAK